MAPVKAKLQRHPAWIRTMPMTGTPMAEANLAAASKSDVARLRSRSGNQRPMALALAGKVGASPTPSSKRAPKNALRLGAAAAANEAALQMNVPMRPTRRTPSLSSTTPMGNWQSA